MRNILLCLILMGLCGCSSSRRGIRTANAFSLSNGVPPGAPKLPECPYAFPSITKKHFDQIVVIARVKLGAPVAIQGPYTPQLLDWIEKNGRRTEGVSTVSREDFVEGSTVKVLKNHIASGREVFYFEWFDTDDSGFTHGGQSGFIVVERGAVIDVISLIVV